LEFFFKWMTTRNPNFGHLTPIHLMEIGRGHKVAAFIREAMEDEEAAKKVRTSVNTIPGNT
jgi:hypothetical protein